MPAAVTAIEVLDSRDRWLFESGGSISHWQPRHGKHIVQLNWNAFVEGVRAPCSLQTGGASYLSALGTLLERPDVWRGLFFRVPAAL